MLSNLFTIAALAGLAFSLPTASPNPAEISSRQVGVSVSDALLKIAPTSGSCSGSPAAGECATNVQAAPFLIQAMAKYGIYNMHEINAILSIIAFESGDFKYNINHFPGNPGQGTRNMQMANFNLAYALDQPELVPKVNAITTATSTSGLSNDQLNAIRALVLPDEYSWASGAWYYAKHCSDSVKTALQAGGQASYIGYLGCVGVTDPSGRLAYWTRGNAAFGLT